MKYLYQFFLFLIFFYFNSANCNTPFLKERISKASIGDYIVASIAKNNSVLFIRAKSDSHVTLEEITTPFIPKLSWKEWKKQGAPGHSSWTAFQIDLNTAEVVSCFSLTQNQFLVNDKEEQLLPKLFAIPFTKAKEKDFKKIGLPPKDGEEDRRKIWLPSLVIEGKKIDNPSFELWKAKWPKDQSLISEAEISLYLDSKRVEFPFPYFIEIQSSHYSFKIRVIDSGKNFN
ncbi:MAG: hypothetical protein L0207_04790 [Chlamydiae bacterium]|nr:hypothetical protein [Chlamydiota bacterium]